MNFDSAVRFEVEKTRGKPSILWQQDNPKKNDRKFGYKEKDMRHQIRKPQAEDPGTTYSSVRNGKSPEDFIKKNRESLGKSPGQSTGSKLTPNSVTLTQEQLNAILASVDNEHNEIHVSKTPTDQQNESPNYSEGNILSLSDYDKQQESRYLDRSYSYDGNTQQEKKNDTSYLPTSEHKDSNGAKATNEQNGGIDLPPLVHKNHMTVGERKRLQWAKERGEQQAASDPFLRQDRTYQNVSAIGCPFYTETSMQVNGGHTMPSGRKAVLEPRARPVQNVTSNGEKPDTYDPWGKPGCGAKYVPTKKQEETDSDTKYDFMGRPIQEHSVVQDMYTVKNSKNRDSKKEWMAELEKQMEEQKQRKQKEREMEKTLGDMSWLDRFTTDHKPAPLPEQISSVQNRIKKMDVL